MYAPTLLAVVTFAAPQASASILRLKPRLPVSVPSGLRYLTSYRFSAFSSGIGGLCRPCSPLRLRGIKSINPLLFSCAFFVFRLAFFIYCANIVYIKGKEVNMTPSEIITSISLLVASIAALIKAVTGLIKEMRRKPKNRK